MVRADQGLPLFSSIPPGVIGVSAVDMSGASHVVVWRRLVREAVEKAGYEAQEFEVGGIGGAAGGPWWMEPRRLLTQNAPVLRRVVDVADWARKEWLRLAYRKARHRLPARNLLDVYLTAGPIDRKVSSRWVTTQDLVGLLESVRDVLDERGDYRVYLSAETRAGGSLSVASLSDKDLRRPRVIRRLTQVAEGVQSSSEELLVKGESLRAWKWNPAEVSPLSS